MEIDILRLSEVVQAFNRERKRPGRSKTDALALVRDELKDLATQALNEDPEMLPVVISLIYLLVDFRDGAIPDEIGEEALLLVEERLSQGWLQPDWSSWLQTWVLRGAPVAAHPGPGRPLGCTLMRWGAFCDYYAASYGKAKFSPNDRERLWNRLRRKKIEVTQSEMHLDGKNGVVWFTDEEEFRRDCRLEDGPWPVDAGRAYDRLGLDWSRCWERDDPRGGGSSRAVLLSVPMEWRHRAQGGICTPTALEGWGSLTFVPGSPPCGGPWPSVGSFTVDPVSGERGLPEGVHGRIEVAGGERCAVEGCGKISKKLSDRVAECGSEIVGRAVRRL